MGIGVEDAQPAPDLTNPAFIARISRDVAADGAKLRRLAVLVAIDLDAAIPGR